MYGFIKAMYKEFIPRLPITNTFRSKYFNERYLMLGNNNVLVIKHDYNMSGDSLYVNHGYENFNEFYMFTLHDLIRKVKIDLIKRNINHDK